MVCGMFVSIVCVDIVLRVFGKLFMIFVANEASAHVIGLPSAIAYLTIYISAMLIFAHRLFGITLHLPKTVLNWIGAHLGDLGEHADESKSRGHYVMIAQRSERVLTESVGATKSKAKKMGGLVTQTPAPGAGGGGEGIKEKKD